jgi:hypothetical protein
MEAHMTKGAWLAATFFACLCWGMAASQSQPSPDVCAFDRAKMLALDERSFDQDIEGGWRTLAMHEECWEITADLIRDYRQARASSSRILFWHEGQMRAFAGQTETAILLFEETRELIDLFGWNLYVDGTIAFLNKDKTALLKARATLATIPKPDGFQPSVKDAQGNIFKISWPLNLNVIDDLIKYFDQPYKIAYGCSAR